MYQKGQKGRLILLNGRERIHRDIATLLRYLVTYYYYYDITILLSFLGTMNP